MNDSLTDKIADTTQTLENRAHYAVMAFRARVVEKLSVSNSDAGAAALKYVLNESDTSSRELAIRLKARTNALSVGMDRVNGEWQYRDSAEKFVAKVPRMLTELAKYHEELAGSCSLKIVELTAESETYIANRGQAVKEHQASAVYIEMSQLFDEVFKPLQGLTDKPAAA